MSAEADPPVAPEGPELEAVRQRLAGATQRLLGDTIAVADPDWAAASRLPGWSRGHVATHLARQADALGRLVQGTLTGHPQPMYASAEQRTAEIESGARRTGIELQTDVDTAADTLTRRFEAVDDVSAWDTLVELRGGEEVPVRSLPLARLSEVVLHHVDLDVGFSAEDVDRQTAELLLQWCAYRLRRRTDFPRLLLHADSGFRQPVGGAGDAVQVSGSPAALLGWLTGRGGASSLTGTDTIALPAFG